MSRMPSYDYPVSDQLDLLGIKLRKIRQKRTLNLVTVATACGVSASLLSQVERGIVLPSLNTLYSLCNYYKVSLFELFAEDTADEVYTIVAKEARRKVFFSGSNVMYELISPASVTNMSVLELDVGAMPQEHANEHIPVAHTHEECVLVQEGELEIILGDRSIHLKKGDSVYYNGATPHVFRRVGDVNAKVLLVTVPAV